ncbi:VirD4-like conjugal transfer protein, CD1115 family [Desulfofundulus thermocisternus]|uniref:VirD4-like conjugal transfer protein, CD1115 family n=1 Tax=Desulfofundulus thermocisternus TaxID=42471 RepID=UPI00217E6E4A|nr:type IV secretory system conjugative DNA transfer family protein [Desulfofundulus thermocisternus]MCS5696983.1 type IV secretory system conjugative DNA transfer family protein [Desulfofundulus thermocisternus]
MNPALNNLKLTLTRHKKALAVGLGCLAIYILDAWLLGSLAAGINTLMHKPVDFTLTRAVWHNPFYAAVVMPFSPAVKIWLVENLIVVILGVFGYFYLATIHPELLPRKKELKFSDDPSCGTSQWLTPEEARRVFETGYGPGTYIGALGETPLRIPNPSDLNFNVMVFGPPKSRKTRTVIGQNVMASVMAGNSIIITDPKGELYRELAVFLENQGYIVKVFNLVNPAHSDRFNPLSVVKTDIDAQMFAKIIIDNTSASDVRHIRGDDFWPRAELNLLVALILYVLKETPKEQRNLGTIYSILSCGNADQIESMFKILEDTHPAKAPFNVYLQVDKKNRGGIVTGLATRLQVFANELIRSLTAENEIHLELPGRTKCAYFCIISDKESTLQFLSSLFFTFLFIKLTNLGDRSPGGTCPVEVQCLLDEFCNIGNIPDFKLRISTMRGRGISCIMIAQSLPQLVNRYPNNVWQEIISCCDTQMFLGINDNMTAKELIEMLGKGTIETVSYRRRAGLEGMFDPGQVTTMVKGRYLMEIDETKRLNRNQAIVIVRGYKPMIVDKLDFSKHPLAKRLIERHIEEYNPPWAAEFKEAQDQLLAEEEREVAEYLDRERQRRASFAPEQAEAGANKTMEQPGKTFALKRQEPTPLVKTGVGEPRDETRETNLPEQVDYSASDDDDDNFWDI